MRLIRSFWGGHLTAVLLEEVEGVLADPDHLGVGVLEQLPVDTDAAAL